MRSRKKAIVIGAGLGGMATAARLAQDGFRVTVVEKESLPGGRAHRIRQAGYTFDTGPTILMMTDVIEDTFHYCERELSDYLDLQQLEPNYTAYYPDGEAITVSSNLPRFTQELARIDPAAPEQFLSFFAATAKIYRLARSQFIDKNFDKVTDFINLKAGLSLLRGRGANRLYSYVSRFFGHPKLRQLFSFQAMYLGVTPYQAPAVYSVVSYMETGLGIWYPKGGMYALSEALYDLCRDLGVTFILQTSCQQILIRDNAVTGVKLDTGMTLKSSLVVSNADLTYTYKHLIAPQSRPKYSDKKIGRLKQASSALLFYWGVDHPLPGLMHHNVFFSHDFKTNLKEIFSDQILPPA